MWRSLLTYTPPQTPRSDLRYIFTENEATLPGIAGLEQMMVAPSKLLVTFSKVRLDVADKPFAGRVSLLNMNVVSDAEITAELLPTWLTDHVDGC